MSRGVHQRSVELGPFLRRDTRVEEPAIQRLGFFRRRDQTTGTDEDQRRTTIGLVARCGAHHPVAVRLTDEVDSACVDVVRESPHIVGKIVEQQPADGSRAVADASIVVGDGAEPGGGEVCSEPVELGSRSRIAGSENDGFVTFSVFECLDASLFALDQQLP